MIYNLISISLYSLIIILTDIYAKTSSLICNKNDIYLNDKFYFLKKKKYILYDVNIGEGFNVWLRKNKRSFKDAINCIVSFVILFFWLRNSCASGELARLLRL